jgi:hypothetical protein
MSRTRRTTHLIRALVVVALTDWPLLLDLTRRPRRGATIMRGYLAVKERERQLGRYLTDGEVIAMSRKLQSP